MILSPKSMLTLIAQGKIIQNLSDRELSAPEGVGFDLTVAKVFILGQGSGSLRLDTRRTPSTTEVIHDSNGCFWLKPKEIYLVSTVEHFDLPTNLAALFYPRSTLFRSGISFDSSVLPPGYSGPMTFALMNNFVKDFELQQGARFAHVIFTSVSGDVRSYEGQWQYGRVSQPDNEEQL
ncbi:dCTP deaminase domain-containing protein [Pseudomonas syringae]|uniref:dCTP deaminase n=1 Tax=Pseudomonas syringae TaxID=317 RepID=UPI0009B155C5|nr:deoxycytidine deaminase [Pseudomonas syringae]